MLERLSPLALYFSKFPQIPEVIGTLLKVPAVLCGWPWFGFALFYLLSLHPGTFVTADSLDDCLLYPSSGQLPASPMGQLLPWTSFSLGAHALA